MRAPASGMLFQDYLRQLKASLRRWRGTYALTRVGTARHLLGPVPLVKIAPVKPQKGGLMLMAGFHGEEPAGPLTLLTGIHHLLGTAADLKVPLVIYPVVNPHGFDNNVRTTVSGGYTNAGFVHDLDPTGPEVAALRQDMARHHSQVFLDLHEDDRESRSYLYAFGDEALGAQLVELLGRFIPTVDGPLCHDASLSTVKGQIRNHHDGSVEDWMSHSSTWASFASETPTRLPLEVRKAANLAIMERCLTYVAQRPGRAKPKRGTL